MWEMCILVIVMLTGVCIYRLGRREGEAGRVLPLVRRTAKQKKADKLLKSIEKYEG